MNLLENFPALNGKAFFLVHPGFGISTPWAYQNLARFPEALNGKARPRRGIDFKTANRMICPPPPTVFTIRSKRRRWNKFPVLELYQEFLRENGALAALMSGSGSTTFAIAENFPAAESLAEKFKSQFGEQRLDGGRADLMAGSARYAGSDDLQRTDVPTLFELRQRKLQHFLRRRNFECQRKDSINHSRR